MAFFNEWGPLLLIGVLFLLLFGATAIPRIMRNLGRAKGEFMLAKKEMDEETKRVLAKAPGADEERKIRETAKSLGIAEEGKSLDEVKRLINEKLA